MIVIQRIFFFHILNVCCPLFVFLLRDFFQKKLQHFPQISDHGSVNHNVLVDFRCIHIDLQDFCLRCEGLGISCDTIAETCAKGNQKITLTHSIVGCFGSMHSNWSCIELILTGKSTFSHQAVTYRCLDLVSQSTHLFGCVCNYSAAAYKDERLLGSGDHLGCSLHILRADGIHLRLYSCDSVTDIFAFRGGHILRDIYKDRSRTTAFCYGKSFANGVRKLCYVFYNVAVFCHRHYDSCDIHLLERILSKKCSSYVTGNCHHRNRVHACGCDSGYQVGCSRS